MTLMSNEQIVDSNVISNRHEEKIIINMRKKIRNMRDRGGSLNFADSLV